MKVSQLKAALDAYADLCSSLSQFEEAKGLRHFAKLLKGHEKKTVTAFAKNVEKGRKILAKGD